MESHDTGTTHFINLYDKVVALWLSVQDIGKQVFNGKSVMWSERGICIKYISSLDLSTEF